MKSNLLYQEATRVRRKAKWLADDYLRLTGDMEGYRTITRLRRRFIWYCGFWNYRLNWLKALREIYAPVISDLFKRQTTLWELFNSHAITSPTVAKPEVLLNG